MVCEQRMSLWTIWRVLTHNQEPGWMDEWMDGWVDGWMSGRLNEWTSTAQIYTRGQCEDGKAVCVHAPFLWGCFLKVLLALRCLHFISLSLVQKYLSYSLIWDPAPSWMRNGLKWVSFSRSPLLRWNSEDCLKLHPTFSETDAARRLHLIWSRYQ